ncbi:MAG: hypothetical protein H7Z75_09215, partial [Ferruginibacter sp.]|nr:hypothetical protein [Cytophagales bacterium]
MTNQPTTTSNCQPTAPDGRSRRTATTIALLLLAYLPSRAQTFGNEWINYDQTYYKIPVVEKGLYRITVNALTNAGFPVSTVNPKTIQLFRRGREQALFVSGEGDERIDEGDYLEFYGQGNDGAPDSLLYLPHSAQPHPYYSLYSDTAAYFLTWRTDDLPGKRMENFIQANVANLPVEPYHREEILRLFTDEFAGGQIYPVGTNQQTVLSQWDAGEGWMSASFNKASNLDMSFTLARSVGGMKPRLEILLVGRNNRPHNVACFAGSSTASLRSLGSVEYGYMNKQLLAFDLEPGDVAANGDLIVRIRSNGYPNEPNDRNSVGYVRIRYAQNFDAGGSAAAPFRKLFYLTPNPAGRSYLEILTPPPGIRLYDLTDPDAVRTIGGNGVNGKYTAIVNNTALGVRTILANAGFSIVLPLQRVRFRNFDPALPNYLIVSHRALMKAAGGFPDAVRAYAGYRASPAGGGYDTLVVDTDLLYNQFNYGEFSPLALRRFADFVVKSGKRGAAHPPFLFLIGRSWHPHFGRKNPFRYLIDLVPTAGYPGSDGLLTAGLNGNPANVPALATGRLNVPSGVVPNFPTTNVFNRPDPQEVIAYLNKVKEHESQPLALYRKDLLHLSGGQSANELTAFKQFMDGFGKKAEGSYLGGRVATISKRTANAVEFINVEAEVNRGLGVLTFFGHSGANSTDINIGYVSDSRLNFRNKGKYPFVLVNGCEAGDISYGSTTFGSDWINTPDKGAVLFMAHSHVGYSIPLKRFTDQFYATAFADSAYVYKPFGLVHREILRRYVAGTSSEYDVANAQQMTLQGDPAVAIFPASKPDYALDGSRLFLRSFGNETITAATDSFQVGMVVANYGITDGRSFAVGVKRTLGNGTVLRYDTLLYPPVNYQDTLYFTIRNRAAASATALPGGNHQFEVRLDVTDLVAELNENNNAATLDYLFPAQGVRALFPREYSIVNTRTDGRPSVVLTAQTAEGNANAGARGFLFEIDTTHTYQSPGKRSQTLNADFLATWNPTLFGADAAHDSTVYYWRVRFADQPEGPDNVWAESSFIYLANSPEGWSQSRFPQFSKSSNARIRRNPATDRWEYEEILTKIGVQTGGGGLVEPHLQTQLLLNDFPVLAGGKCGTNALVGVAFRQNTTLPYSAKSTLLCNNSIPYVANFMYDGNILNANDQLTQYLDAVPAGDYVLLFTLGTVSFSNWTPALRQKLVDLGADPAGIASLQTGYPYILLGRKGALPGGAPLEVRPEFGNAANPPAGQSLSLARTLNGRYGGGDITSSTIGPASAWGNLFRKVADEDPSDQWALDVVGMDAQGNETTVQSGVPTDGFGLAGVDARQYPYLKLRLRTVDSAAGTPPQLRRWQVTYQGVPEGLINPGLVGRNEYAVADKGEGEDFRTRFVFQNISPRPFSDSLTLRTTLLNKTTGQREVSERKLKRLAPGDTVQVTLPVQTRGRVGDNLLSVFFNPRVLPEEYYENNVLEVPFRVRGDRTNPLLDVVFDGIRIMNGDIVSPSPLVAVSLKDENPFLLRKDTVGLEIFLKKPGATTPFEKVSFSGSDIRYFPAGEGSNDFRVEYHPRNLADGTHTLRVQGADVSGNASGVEPYQIDFEVITESKITHFYPYPNPFSTQTRFVFTLTGADLPDQIKIQVMTVTGRVVREITQDELGPLRIGNNVSAYAWDGTDEFGDKLA